MKPPWMNRWWILARGNRKNLGEKPKQLPKQRHQRTVSKPKQRSRRKRKTSPRNQPVPKPKPARKKSPAWRVKKAKREQSQVAMAEGKKKILWKRRCTVFLVFGYDVKWSNCQTTSFEHFFYLSAFFKWLQSQLRFTVKHIHLWRRQEWTAKHVPRRQQRQGFSFLLAFNFLAGKMFLIFRFRLSTTDLL